MAGSTGRQPTPPLEWLALDPLTTLYQAGHFDPASVVRQLMPEQPMPSAEKFAAAYGEVKELDRLGHITSAQKYRRLLGGLRLPVNNELVGQLVGAEEAAFKNGLGVLDGAVDFLLWARDSGLRLLAIVDTTEVGLRVLIGSGLLAYFTNYGTSREERLPKSDNRRFLYQSFVMGHARATGLVIDGQLSALESANRAGLPTCLFAGWTPPMKPLSVPFKPTFTASSYEALRAVIAPLI